MDPEEKALLKRAVELSQENNHILRKMQNAARWRRFWGFIKLAIVVLLLVLGYIRLAPYIENLSKNIDEVKGILPALNSVQSYLPR